MSRTYGQFCGLARALEMVGERWSMLVVRDLVMGHKTFTDLRAGLPRIPESILSSRLNDLERVCVVRRRVLPQLDASVVYELTEYGAELEAVVLQLGLWGARSLGEATEGDVFTVDTAVLSLYATFRPEHARVRVAYELRFGPEIVLHAVIDDGGLKVSEGSYADADLVVETFGSLRPLMAGETSAHEAIEAGVVRVTGDPTLLDLFAEMFHIPAAPQRVHGLTVH